MTLLTAGLISGQFEVYNYPNNKLNAALLEDRLKKLEQVDYQPSQNEAVMSYSPMFIDVVRRLLDLNSETRMKRSELYEMLLPNVNSIMHLEPFSLEPPKGKTTKTTTVNAITHTSPVKMHFNPLPAAPQPVPVKHQVVLKTAPAVTTTTTNKTSTNVVFKTQGGVNKVVDFSPPKQVQVPVLSPPKPTPVYQPAPAYSPPKPILTYSPPKPVLSYSPPKPPLNVTFSPPKPDDGKEVVVLRGRKKEEKIEEVSFGGDRVEGTASLNLAESQYVATEGGVDWLKRIDEQLERSRQLFPK